jgi:hypothetical protein
MLRIVARAVTPAIQSACRPAYNQAAVRLCATHSPWGQDHWRHDKNAFKQWCTDAMSSGTKAEAEFYGFLAIAFGDVDANKDGLINHAEFDLLCEKVASLPRRYGMAPSWEKEYGGSIEKRTAARRAMFDALDTRNGPARGVLGMKQFIRWARDHVGQKVKTLDTKTKVDFAHIEDYDEETFLAYLESALNDPASGAYATLYEFLLCTFVEADATCTGTINRQEFDVLIEKAAKVPRQFGLAPAVTDDAAHDKVFATMDDNNSGTITFRKFMAWTVEHTKYKIKLQRAGMGYKR